jgi:uncharacterized protein YbjT (DUF2867 family)
VVLGDLTQPEMLAPALEGIDRMYLFPVDKTAREVVALAKQAGVRRIVDLSAASVTAGLHTNPVEQAVEESGLEWTHVRPCGFMANMLQIWAPLIRAERVVRYPFADEPMNLIHEADIAAVAAVALLEDGHHGAAYTLTGPAHARLSALGRYELTRHRFCTGGLQEDLTLLENEPQRVCQTCSQLFRGSALTRLDAANGHNGTAD